MTMSTQPRTLQKRQRGFSLIELLIVMAVILVIAAIAIPNFVRSRMRANEAAAVANLRTINIANVAYMTTYGIGFAGSLTKLAGNTVIVDSNAAGLIDEVLASGKKNGYAYSYTPGAADTLGHINFYTITAKPMSPGTTGDRYFFTNQTDIIHFSTAGTATDLDPPI